MTLLMSDTGSNEQRHPNDFQVGDWRVMPSMNRIQKNGETVNLQHLSMKVLIYLSERAGQVVSYDELLESLWANRMSSENVVHQRIADLRRKLGDESREPRYIETTPKRGYCLIATVGAVSQSTTPKWRRPVLIAAAPLAALIVSAIILNKADNSSPVVVLAIAEARSLLAVDDYARAYLAIRPLIETKYGDAELDSLLAEISLPVSIESSPPNADVFYKLYGQSNEDWKRLGITPFESVLPRSTWLLKFVADGHDSVQLALPNPGMAFNNVNRDYYVVQLPRATAVPDDMVFVPGGKLLVPLVGFRGQEEDLGDFYIGKTEVSNAQYAEFLTDGGYEVAEYWTDLPAGDDGVGFQEVTTRFVDSTGVPGPSGWSNGTFRLGSENRPVTGVSWYEAIAYARYRGAKLPTARHWARAALGIDESHWPLAPALIPEANLQGSGPLDVDEGSAISTWGSVNLIGNVREWTVSFSGDLKLSLGASFRGPSWDYALPVMAHPLQRNPDQGIRLAMYDESIDNPPLGLDGALPEIPAVSDETYAGFEQMFDYTPGNVGADSAQLVSEVEEHDWIRRKILIPTDDPENPLPVLLFLPKNAPGPLQSILFFPPGNSYFGRFLSDNIDITRYNVDFVVRSGRVLIWPILIGMHERYRPREDRGGAAFLQSWPATNERRRNEIGRVIDYLQGNAEFDGEQVGLLAASFGATFVSPHVLAAESRIKAAVLMSSSLAGVNRKSVPDRVNPNTYWPRVRTPILVLNGRFDIHIPYSPDGNPMLNVIGTAEGDKRSVYYDSSHWPLPQHRVKNDTLEWFDRYLGIPATAEQAGDRRY